VNIDATGFRRKVASKPKLKCPLRNAKKIVAQRIIKATAYFPDHVPDTGIINKCVLRLNCAGFAGEGSERMAKQFGQTVAGLHRLRLAVATVLCWLSL
jgi:hypothetical protein